VNSLRGSFLNLARHKFGSNLIEKIITSGGSEDDPTSAFTTVMEEILLPGGLEALLDDPFANYVVQGAIRHCALDGDDSFLPQLQQRIAAFDRGHPGWVRMMIVLCPRQAISCTCPTGNPVRLADTHARCSQCAARQRQRTSHTTEAGEKSGSTVQETEYRRGDGRIGGDEGSTM
jgi:hypothetical protein